MEKFTDMSLNAKKWALFLGIAMILSGVISLASQDWFNGIINLLLGSILINFQSALGKSVNNDDVSEFEVACEKQGLYVKSVGILSLLGLILISLGLVVGIVAGVLSLFN